MTKKTADMAEQRTVQPHVGDIMIEDAEDEAPSVNLDELMDGMTRRFERLLAEQDERRAILFAELLDGKLGKIEQTFDGRVGELTDRADDLAEQTTSLRDDTVAWKTEVDGRLRRLESHEPTPTDSFARRIPVGLPVHGTRSVTRQRPPKYDGKTIWESYIAQFEIAATLNEWSTSEKAAFLATSLEGNATSVLGAIPADRRTDYAALVSALETRFGSAVQKELSRVKLRNRRRQRGEPLAEMADEVERLARLAYNDAPIATQDTHAKEQFIDAITDDDLRVRVLQSRPTNLQEALRSALELESYTLAVRHTPNVRAVDAVSHDNNVVGIPTLMKEMVDRFSTCITQQFGNLAIGDRQPGPSSTPLYSGCWNCGDTRHYRAECPGRDGQAVNHSNRRRRSPAATDNHPPRGGASYDDAMRSGNDHQPIPWGDARL